MVFNWFRRQFSTSEKSPEETPAETPQVEEQQETEQQAVEAAESDSTQEQSEAVAEDYLLWAKAAYKNIQKRQQPSEETATTATEAPEVASPQEPATQAEVTQTAVPEQVEATEPTVATEAVEEPVTSTVESAEPTVTETPETQEAPSPETEVAHTGVEAAIIETAQAVSEQEQAPVEPAATQAEADTSAEAAPEVMEPATAALADAALTVSSEEVGATEPTTTLEPSAAEAVEAAETPVPVSEEPAAAVPVWARQSSAQRQARLERLKATAIETEEPEPVKPAAQQEQPAAAATIEVEEVPGLAFDEAFVWSAEVLAAQGRRPEDVSIEEISWLKRLRQGLSKTRRGLINQLKAIVGQGPLNQDAVMEVEALLLQADVGVEATDYIINTLQQKLRSEALPPEQAIAYLKQIIRDLLDRPYQDSYSPTFAPEKDTLNIWLMTGVNGVGKTTTIGKIAHLAQKSGYRCLIAAGDTFRAAAVQQVQIWGERSGTEVIANPGKNTDPAAVVFDAISAAQARNTELLLVDTAGRLQNKKNLMEELAKIRKIIDKKAPDAKVESLLVLDATLGQNGLRQAEVFSEAAKLSGVILTKLDGTAKGGVALAVVQQMGLPIRFIGAGEGIEDLRPFSSYEFVEALISG